MTPEDIYLTQTRIKDKYAIRLVSGGPLTQQRHLDKAWQNYQTYKPHNKINMLCQIVCPHMTGIVR